SVEESVQLIIDSAMLAKGGEVFVTKMPVIAIKDLAEVMIRKLAAEYGQDPAKVEIREIGVKPGEKLYEELMTGEETGRAIELERYFVIKPAIMKRFTDIDYSYEGVISEQVVNPYHSGNEPKLSQDELAVFL